MKKLEIAAAAMALVALAHGATINISSGDVVALTNAIATYSSSSDKLMLAPGDYNLAGIQMEEAGSSYGKTHLVVSGAHLVGQGENPEDVRLVGDGTCRVYRMINNTYARLQNLTITNGYAKTIEGAADSKNGGGIYGYPTVTNCVIIGNKADGNGGGTCHYTYIWASKILNNTAATGGGAYQPNYIINSLVSGNRSTTGHGGGIYGNGYGRAEGSRIIGNVAGGAGGGACAVNNVTNCVIAQNTASSGGGALYSWGRSSKFAYDCTICSNKTTSGGAMYEYTVVGGKIFANYGQNGGGAVSCNLLGVELHDNYATGYGGGVHSCNVTNCVLRNNFKGGTDGANAYNSTLYGCDISGTGIHGGNAVNCVLHDIVDNPVIEGNPYIEGAMWTGHVFAGIPVCTNCLFRNNRLVNYSRTMFCGAQKLSRDGSIVNCTIVSNKYGNTFNYMTNDTHSVTVKNCVFLWNEGHDTTDWRDIHSWGDVSSNVLRFANCAYGTASGRFNSTGPAALANSSDGPMYKFGSGGFPSNPKFDLGSAEHPYQPRYNSPLRGRGAVEDWMANGTDIRGEGYGRLRDGKVDIGCYQSWLQPVGMTLTFR